MRKHGAKVLGLALVAAIGLMALSAASALAVELKLGDEFYSGEPGEFLVNSGTLSPVGLATAAIKSLQIGSGRLMVPAKSVEINCDKGDILSSVTNEYENFNAAAMGSGGHGSGTIIFNGCKVEEINSATGALTGKKLTSCVPNFSTTPGLIVAEVLWLLKKHEGVTYLLLVPKVTNLATAEANEKLVSAFAKVSFDETKCFLTPIALRGSLVTKAPAADALKPRLKFDSFSAAGKTEQKLFGAKLTTGVSEAFVQAEWDVELVGKFVPWGAM